MLEDRTRCSLLHEADRGPQAGERVSLLTHMRRRLVWAGLGRLRWVVGWLLRGVEARVVRSMVEQWQGWRARVASTAERLNIVAVASRPNVPQSALRVWVACTLRSLAADARGHLVELQGRHRALQRRFGVAEDSFGALSESLGARAALESKIRQSLQSQLQSHQPAGSLAAVISAILSAQSSTTQGLLLRVYVWRLHCATAASVREPSDCAESPAVISVVSIHSMHSIHAEDPMIFESEHVGIFADCDEGRHNEHINGSFTSTSDATWKSPLQPQLTQAPRRKDKAFEPACCPSPI